MMRTVAAVVVGYVVMAVMVFATFSAAYLGMGSERAFQPGSYRVTVLWIVVSSVLALLAAVVGGYVSAVVARSEKGPKALAVLVVVLGALLALPVLTDKNPPVARADNVPNMQAMQNAKPPVWVALLNPLLGVAGVMVGAGLRRRTTGAELRTAV